MLSTVFEELSNLLRKHAEGLDLCTAIDNSKAKGNKPGLHLYSREKIAIPNRPLNRMYLAGIIMQKDYVGLYYMPIADDSKPLMLSPALKKTLKGKSCFHIKSLTPDMIKEIDSILASGKKDFQKRGWL